MAMTELESDKVYDQRDAWPRAEKTITTMMRDLNPTFEYQLKVNKQPASDSTKMVSRLEYSGTKPEGLTEDLAWLGWIEGHPPFHDPSGEDDEPQPFYQAH